MHSAKLVTITPDAENQIVYMARVSNPQGQDVVPTGPRLIRYLINHRHWSPFEMANLVVEINTTRSIGAQILRHRSFCFQEFSQRYADPKELPPMELPQLRRQDLENRQSSHDDLDPKIINQLNEQIKAHHNSALDLYQEMLRQGVAKECAREVLPLGTPSRLYMNGTIRSWLHYLQVRAGVETQLEHRLIAESIKDIFAEQLPVIYEAAFCG